MVGPGPRPGKTPIKVPRRTPTKQRRKFMGSDTTEKPRATFDQKSIRISSQRFQGEEGHEVKCVMTENAARFISPHLVFLPLSNNPVYVDMWAPPQTFMVEHIELAKWADVVLVAPATANTIGKLVNSIADNLLLTVLLAVPSTTPIFVAPAMNTEMWNNAFFQAVFMKMKKHIILNKPKMVFLPARQLYQAYSG